ncbi:helix-turn-helix transcriptional regulator [Pararhodobacter sp.]|uniref:AraC family transcriptional regulator n=1 Tax=Pararhodobacter sp. TaxID=2127056 RepID=UPI002AFDF251|nr:helix-turn-helix transcriptional regulator [Pararhodobacter sp.]
MNAMPHRRPDGGFMEYLHTGKLPCQKSDMRRIGKAGATMAIVHHAPTHGIEYPPVDDLIVSVILNSAQAPAVRDIGDGAQHFLDEAGKVVITPPGRASFWQFESAPTVLHLSVSQDRLRYLAGDDWHRHSQALQRLAQQPDSIPLVGRSAAKLWTLGTASPGAPQSAAADQELDRLLTVLLDWPERGTGTANPGAGLSARRLQSVMGPMREAEPDLSVHDLAILAGLSADHFCRAFRASTGFTPHQMLTHGRIEKAKLRLQEPGVSMTTIAMDLGFSSSAHFSSRFRQLTGFSPSEWREFFAPSPKTCEQPRGPVQPRPESRH